jgi:hypothetical protein
MEGSLSETDLPGILGALSGVRDAGLLTLSGEGTTAKVRIQDGYVLAATSDRESPLGHALVAAGIDPAHVDGALAIQRRKKIPQPLGSLLVDLDLAGRTDVEKAIEIHIREILRDILEWTDGEFLYEPCERVDGHVVTPLSLRIDSILLSMFVELADARED